MWLSYIKALHSWFCKYVNENILHDLGSLKSQSFIQALKTKTAMPEKLFGFPLLSGCAESIVLLGFF